MFGDIEIVKHKFHRYKNHISLNDIYFGNIFISKKTSTGKKNYKYFKVRNSRETKFRDFTTF